MFTVVPVRFSYVARDLWFDVAQTAPVAGDALICRTERGIEIGHAVSSPRQVSEEELKKTIRDSELKPVLRIATDQDLEKEKQLYERSKNCMNAYKTHVEALDLDMKPVGVDILFDEEKAVFYFTADERVDFRELVKRLAHEFHIRIDMRQIGLREQASFAGGYGTCGQQLCCARFMSSLEPVSIRMAKEQDLSLNSSKISGACGRLMCCLHYEFEAYKDFKSRAPKKNAQIDTPLGTGKVIGFNTPKEIVEISFENGKQIQVPLSQMSTSEAAVARCKETGCVLRPDSVTRKALERLQSVEVQMALEEIDRKSGLLPEIQTDQEDLFVKQKTRQRKKPDAAKVRLKESKFERTKSDSAKSSRVRTEKTGQEASKKTAKSRSRTSSAASQLASTSKSRVSRRHVSKDLSGSSTVKSGISPHRVRHPGDRSSEQVRNKSSQESQGVSSHRSSKKRNRKDKDNGNL